MMNPTVRPASSDDWRALRDVRLRALAESPTAFASTTRRETVFGETRWRQRAQQGNWFLAWPGDGTTSAGQVPAGLVAGVLRPGSGGCELAGMWVEPAARGVGVGRELIATVAGWARRSGDGRLDLWVFADHDGARAFYRRQGFLETGETQELPERPGALEIGMTLPLI